MNNAIGHLTQLWHDRREAEFDRLLIRVAELEQKVKELAQAKKVVVDTIKGTVTVGGE